MGISAETARDIAFAHREIDSAKNLLKQIAEARTNGTTHDIRDAFGRRRDGLQLGVPTGDSSKRLFDVPWSMCRPIIEAHISQQRSLIEALSEKALIEMHPVSESMPGLA